ncbi:MAG: hypothetical protein Q8R16_00255 [bacterium]|nr:hypothetical protein [bacterium]
MDLSNAEKIARIRAFQESGFHQLTCGNNSDHDSLEPEERDGAVILVCREARCDYTQSFIPDLALAPVEQSRAYRSLLKGTP